MEYIISIPILIFTLLLFRIIFKINIKKIKDLEENKEMNNITDKFPENIEIAKDMLEMLGNKGVEVEEAKDTKTSLYIAITNKIVIADMKDNYARIQTIAHECIHSCQDRRLLLFNFFFSNIAILYPIIVIVLTLFKIIEPNILQIFVIAFLSFIQYVIRSFLEIDAMTKAKYLAKEYMEKKRLCSKEEIALLLEQYEKINKIGIPFVLNHICTEYILRILIYVIVAILVL